MKRGREAEVVKQT